MCPKWQANSLHFNVYRHFCKLDMEEVIAKMQVFVIWMKIAKIKVSISLTALSLLILVPEILRHDRVGSNQTHSSLHTALYNIRSLASAPYVHMSLKNLNYLRLLTLEDLSQLLIGPSHCKCVVRSISPPNYPLISLIQKINCCTILLLVKCLQVSRECFNC